MMRKRRREGNVYDGGDGEGGNDTFLGVVFFLCI
jgi:hypothetical protein